MTLEKRAQEFHDLPEDSMVFDDQNFADDIVFIDDSADDDKETVVLEVQEPGEDKEELIFSLPLVPGAEDDSEIVINDDIDVDEENDKVEVSEKDPWDWASRGLSNFLGWLHEMMLNVPRHSGRDTTGLEKAIAHFEALDKEITKAMRQDYRDEIDSAKAEQARAQIEDGLERLVERLEKVKTTKYKRHRKKKKKAEQEALLVKQAQKATHIHGMVITVPLFISHLARICINGSVSGGHDIEDMYYKLAKRYDLTDREKAELVQVLMDMNYPIRLDRGYIGDEGNYDSKRSDNFDHAANFPG